MSNTGFTLQAEYSELLKNFQLIFQGKKFAEKFSMLKCSIASPQVSQTLMKYPLYTQVKHETDCVTEHQKNLSTCRCENLSKIKTERCKQVPQETERAAMS